MTVALPMSEAQLQQAVVDCARHLGYRVYHTYDSRRSDAGFPDLVLVRGPHLIFAELKSEKGRLSGFQVRWLEALEETSALTFVWKPQDWVSGAIEQILRDPSASRVAA